MLISDYEKMKKNIPQKLSGSVEQACSGKKQSTSLSRVLIQDCSTNAAVEAAVISTNIPLAVRLG